jgi:hypothetical protein
MNPQTYAQMLALQQQQGQPLTSQGQGPQSNAPIVPRYDSQNPLSEGSMQAVNAARQSMGGRKKGMLSGLLDVANQFSINSLRGSDTAAGRALGHSFRTPDEKAEEESQKNYKMMQFLAAQNQANQEQDYRQQKMMQENAYRQQGLSERMRHNRALESQYGERLRMSGDRNSKEEKGLMDMEILQSEIPDAVPFSAMTAQERSLASKNLKSRINAPKHSGHSLEILDEIVKITQDHPSLAGSFTTLLAKQPVSERFFMDNKERTALNKFRTLTRQLALSNVEKGVGNARMGVFLEKLISEAKPDPNMTPDAIKYLRDQARELHKETIIDSKIAKKANSGIKGIGRYDVPEYYEEYKEPSQNPVSNMSKMSDEELLKIAQ